MKRYKKKWGLLLITALFLSGIVWAQGTSETLTSCLNKNYPDYVIFLSDKKIDSVFYYANTSIAPVIFKVNKYKLYPNKQLDSIADILRRIQQDTIIRLSHVWVGGSASPEGPPSWNHRLGEYRSRALADFLLQETGIPESKLKVENLCEDWYSFEVALKNGAQIPNKSKVLDILTKETDNERRKKQIKALDGGYTWQRIIQDVFPPFRNARIAIVCLEEQFPLPPVSKNLQVAESRMPDLNPAISFSLQPSQQEKWIIAIKSNLLFVAALTANLGIEISPFSHWSFDLPVWYSPYNITPERKLRLLAVQPEIRWWSKEAMKGHFIGLHTHVAGFNVAINDHGRYQDPNHALWGMGISYGYAVDIGKMKRWTLECNIGAGFAEFDYDVYRNWKNGPKFRSGSDWYWGITRGGVSISYKWYKQRKR